MHAVTTFYCLTTVSPDIHPTSVPPPPPGPPMTHKLKPVTDKTPPNRKKFGLPPPENEVAEVTQKRPVSPLSKTPGIPKPPMSSKPSGIAERMKKFQQNSSEGKSPPPGAKGLKAPPTPAINENLMPGPKNDKKAKISDLTSMFGGRGSMTSPVSDRSSPSPEARPNLPPRPSGTL